MDDVIDWSGPGFNGVAYLWPAQVNASNAFLRLLPDGTVGPYPPDGPPEVWIPVEGGVPVVIVADVSVEGAAAFLLDAAASDAALVAREMWWVEAGRRTGTIAVRAQP